VTDRILHVYRNVRAHQAWCGAVVARACSDVEDGESALMSDQPVCRQCLADSHHARTALYTWMSKCS
jgi:hypothetical protein